VRGRRRTRPGRLIAAMCLDRLFDFLFDVSQVEGRGRLHRREVDGGIVKAWLCVPKAGGRVAAFCGKFDMNRGIELP
jgi:hypothetical protein